MAFSGMLQKESESVSMMARFRTLSSTGILRPPWQWRPGTEGTVPEPPFGELALRPCGLESEGGMAPLWKGGEMGVALVAAAFAAAAACRVWARAPVTWRLKGLMGLREFRGVPGVPGSSGEFRGEARARCLKTELLHGSVAAPLRRLRRGRRPGPTGRGQAAEEPRRMKGK
jgi:hypothetical protein